MTAKVILVGGPNDGEIENYPADRIRPTIRIRTVENRQGPVYKSHEYELQPFPHVPSMVRVFVYKGITSEITGAEITARALAEDLAR